MRSAMYLFCAASLLALTGCNHHNLVKSNGAGCQSCGGGHGSGYAGGHAHGHGGHGHNSGLAHGHGGGHGHGHGGDGLLSGLFAAPAPVGPLPPGYMEDAGPPGPPVATYAYPYYTTRAPRDFLLDNPPSIGN